MNLESVSKQIYKSTGTKMNLTNSKSLILLLIITTVHGLEKKTLNESYEEFKELRHDLLDDYEVGEYYGRYNETCIAQHLKLEKFGHKTVNEAEEDILMDSALFKCSESDAFIAGKLIKTRVIKTYELDEDVNFMNCLKSKLVELEPTTTLVSTQDRKKLSSCTDEFQHLLPFVLKDFLNTLNEHILNTTCGKVTAIGHTKTFIKEFLVCTEDLSTAIRNIEEKKLLKEMKFTQNSAYDCIMTRFENSVNIIK